MKKPKRKILRFILLSLGALALIGAAAVVSALPEAIEVLRYPDARSGRGEGPVPSAPAFNVRRERNPLSGVNFGLALQAPREGDWGVVIDESDFDAAMRAGFGHIRVQVRFLPYLSKEEGAYRIDPGLLKRLDWVIGKILERGMIAIIDLYLIIPDDKLSFSSRRDAESIEERFLAVWGILAEHYKDFPPGLYFELANEPHRPLDSEVWNDYARKAIDLIRGSLRH